MERVTSGKAVVIGARMRNRKRKPGPESMGEAGGGLGVAGGRFGILSFSTPVPRGNAGHSSPSSG